MTRSYLRSPALSRCSQERQRTGRLIFSSRTMFLRSVIQVMSPVSFRSNDDVRTTSPVAPSFTIRVFIKLKFLPEPAGPKNGGDRKLPVVTTVEFEFCRD